jgi:hypothetical protein
VDSGHPAFGANVVSVAAVLVGAYLLWIAARWRRQYRQVRDAPALTCRDLLVQAAEPPGVVCVVNGSAQPGEAGLGRTASWGNA